MRPDLRMQLGQDLARLAALVVSNPDSSDEHAAEALPIPHSQLLPHSFFRSRAHLQRRGPSGDEAQQAVAPWGATSDPTSASCQNLILGLPRTSHATRREQALDLLKRELCCTPAAYPDAACLAACAVCHEGRSNPVQQQRCSKGFPLLDSQKQLPSSPPCVTWI